MPPTTAAAAEKKNGEAEPAAEQPSDTITVKKLFFSISEAMVSLALPIMVILAVVYFNGKKGLPGKPQPHGGEGVPFGK